MKSHPPLLRSRTSKKMVDIKLERYKPRDWDYQSPKHQIRPQFVMGRSKKRLPVPSQQEFPVFKQYKRTFSSLDINKRELKPSVFRSYKLSQIFTLPGAVKVEESKVIDDQYKRDRIKVVRNKNLCFIKKLENEYGSNVEFLPGSKPKEIKKPKLQKGKSSTDIRKIKEEKKTNERAFSPRIKRKNKNKK